MAETMAVPQPAAAQPAAAQPAKPVKPVATAEQRYRTMQIVLFTVGAVLMPAGIVAIILGWYGVAHTKYQYDQLPYVVSGGLLGLGLVFLGGFLYFGAWLAKVAHDQRESTQQLADTMRLIADLVGRQSGTVGANGTGLRDVGAAFGDTGAMPVLAGAGSTVHRRDCPLIAHRDD